MSYEEMYELALARMREAMAGQEEAFRAAMDKTAVAAPEIDWPPLSAEALRQARQNAIRGYEERENQEINEAGILPRAKPVPYPPPKPFKPPSFGNVLFPPYVWQLMTREVLPSAINSVKEAKDDAVLEANNLVQKITYPEPLINEAVNRHISKYRK